MSGGFIAYHLRHNKSIDREIFLESLNIMNHLLPIKDYTYVGFGGPMLEDFRLIHSRTLISSLISLEEDDSILTRQKYNVPYNCIECYLKSSSDFILEYDFSNPTITWLDYASPKKIKSDLDDIQLLSGKINNNDILKVTFPINPSSYYQRRVGEDVVTYKEKFLSALKSKLSRDYLNFNLEIKDSDMSEKNLTNKLSEIIINAFKSALERGLTDRIDDLKFLPVSINKYNDGSHTMLTIMGIFKLPDESITFYEDCGFDEWSYKSNEWGIIHDISIPTLTIKEKINLDSKLPDKDAYEAAANEFALKDDQRENYFKYYRLYPNFQRIMV